MSTIGKKNVQKSSPAEHGIPDLSKDSTVLKRTEMARQFIKKHGLPKDWNNKKPQA